MHGRKRPPDAFAPAAIGGKPLWAEGKSRSVPSCSLLLCCASGYLTHFAGGSRKHRREPKTPVGSENRIPGKKTLGNRKSDSRSRKSAKSVGVCRVRSHPPAACSAGPGRQTPSRESPQSLACGGSHRPGSAAAERRSVCSRLSLLG